MIRDDDGLLAVLAKHLRDASNPLTSTDLYSYPDVRKLAVTPNRVSDYLGNLWRKGHAERVPAPRSNNSSARWAYRWKASQPSKSEADATPIPYTPSVPRSLLKKPNIEVTEDGEITTIELPHLIITIRPKR